MERKRNLQRSTKNHQEILIRLLVSERGRNMDRRNAGDLRYKTARKKQLESDQKSKKTYVQIRNEKRHMYRNYSEKTKKRNTYTYIKRATGGTTVKQRKNTHLRSEIRTFDQKEV